MPLNLTAEYQKALARLIGHPGRGVEEVCAGLDDDFSRSVASSLTRYIESHKFYKRPGKKSDLGGLPNTRERLQFCLKLLRHVDSLIKRDRRMISEADDPPGTLRSILCEATGMKTLEKELFGSLCGVLRLDARGTRLAAYARFINSGSFFLGSPKMLELPLLDPQEKVDHDALADVCWWFVRRNDLRYVVIDDDKIEILFRTLVSQTRQALIDHVDPQIARKVSGALTMAIENEVNRWLGYCCLEGDYEPADDRQRSRLAAELRRSNDLRFPVIVERIDASKQTKQLERDLSRYAKENRELAQGNAQLANRVNELEERLEGGPPDQSKPPPAEDDPAVAVRELREFLRAIDSKYSFHSLRALQLGEEQPISMRNFVGHLFYGLRKRGFGAYPDEDEFDLDYESSGLYRCLDCEVQPGETVRVRVEERGWALTSKGRLFPIRKAKVCRAPEAGDE